VAPTVVRPFFDFKNLPAPATIQISHLELDPILHRQGMIEDSPELATSAKKSSKWWLVAGSLLLGASHMRWGIGVLAWITPIPFLVYVRGTRGIAPRALVGLALFIGYTLAILKICTAPIPPVAAVGFALPTAVLATIAYLVWDLGTRRGPAWTAPLIFASATVVTEYVQHTFTPFASWGAVAYTQIDNLPLLQVSALFGMAAVSFIVNLAAATLEATWATRGKAWRQLATAGVVIIAATTFGTLRLGLATLGETVLVAAVGTDATVGGFPYPSVEEMERFNQSLFARTARAAAAGAKLVLWTEGATLVLAENELAFFKRLGASARAGQIELIAAYVVPNDATATFQNKFIWVRPDGTIDHVYLKHHPVPGEPAVAGREAHRAVETAAGRAAGAICYDFDFPALAREQAKLGIDLALVPSSDWRGIDPIHAQMASLRAIEGGFSLLRSTRMGMTAAYDPYGRPRAWESSFDSNDRIVLAALPRHGVSTLYRLVGDSGVAVCGAFTVCALMLPRFLRRLTKKMKARKRKFTSFVPTPTRQPRTEL
jgi:apolipoprotein N-acyltransferase